MTAVKLHKHKHYKQCFSPGWKIIPGLNNKYEVNERSVVRNRITKRVLTPSKAEYRVSLRLFEKSFCRRIYHLSLSAFFPDIPKNKTVHHIDGNHTNNNVENLMWMSFADNAREARLSRGLYHPKTNQVEPKEDETFITSPALDTFIQQKDTKNKLHVSQYGNIRNSRGFIFSGTRVVNTKYRKIKRKINGRIVGFYVHQLVWCAFQNEIPPSFINPREIDASKPKVIAHDETAPENPDGTYRNWFCDLRCDTQTNNLLEMHESRRRN